MPAFLTTNVVQAVAFVLFLAALPLVSFGTTEGQEALWWIGLGLIVVAGVLPPLARFVPLADDEDDEEEPDDAEAGADDTDGTDAEKEADR